MRFPALHLLLALLAVPLLDFAWAAPARAQLVATATAETEYRPRGVAMTNGKPDVRFGVSYDNPSGFYAGASGIAGKTGADAFEALGYTAYVGFAKRGANGLDWDFGLTHSHIDINIPARVTVHTANDDVYVEDHVFHYGVDYTEAYVGVSARNIGVHLYLSPDYLNRGTRTAYLDVTGAIRPTGHLRLFAHAGALTPLGGGAGPGADREYFDVQAGVAWEFRHGDIQLAWTGTTPQVLYPANVKQRRSALIASVNGFF